MLCLRVPPWLLILLIVLANGPASLWAAPQATFDDLLLPPESFYNGSDLAGGFESGDAQFDNFYNPAFGSWSGFAYSNTTDTTTPGFENQYSAFAGSGAGGSSNYGVAFVSSFDPPALITFPLPSAAKSIDITNTTYAALSMLNGDAFAKRFGGPTGNDPDYFLLTVEGLDVDDVVTGSVDFYLADYRFADNALDYVVDSWQTVDLSPLGERVNALRFALETTDVDLFPNTPFFFALDNVDYVAPRSPDFNGDGRLDCVDIDALVAAIAAGANPPDFDLNGDERVDVADRDRWLHDAGTLNLPSGNSYLLGDGNFDGVVDVSDFNLWNTYHTTPVAAWCKGDFSADGFVDVSDFNLWNEHKFSRSANHAPQAVPEPFGGALAVSAAALIRHLRARGRRPTSSVGARAPGFI